MSIWSSESGGSSGSQSASEIKSLYESNTNTNAYTDADQTKLSGIESSADVTDTENVALAGALIASNNLSDIDTIATARENMGLGNCATKDVGTVSDTVCSGDDSRLSDNRDPNAHAASHTNGVDDIQDATASQKGLMTATQASKLDGVEAGATGDQTGEEIADALISEYGPSVLSFAYGVRWDYSTDTLVGGVLIGSEFVPCDYSSLPIQNQMVRGLLTTSGEFTLLNPDDSNYLASGDGTTPATLDGSAGQVMVRIPKFYALAMKDGNYRYLLISQIPFTFLGREAWIPPAFGDDDYRYLGAFHCVAMTDSVSAEAASVVLDTSGYTSNSYPNPFSSRTRAQFRNQQQDGFFQFSWGLYEVLWMLFLTEFKSFDSQTALPGYTEASGWDYAYTRPAGRTLSLGNASGSILSDLTGEDADLSGIVAADEYVANSYRGIENIFGNIWMFLDGINIDNTTGDCHVYICNDPDNFADDTSTDYTDTGHEPAFGNISAYIKDMAWLGQSLIFYPSEIGNGASSSTYITDSHYNSAGGWRTLLCGGGMSSGASAGLGSLLAHRASSYSDSPLSARSAA